MKRELAEQSLSSLVCGNLPKNSAEETLPPQSNTRLGSAQSEVLRKFNYNPKTGKLTWKEIDHPRWHHKIGQEAGWISGSSYLMVNFRRKAEYVHHIIWLMLYGYWPKSIDHIDHNKLNNKLENLREVNGQLQQCKNFSKRYDNKSGTTGVHWDRGRNKWMAYIKVNYKRIHLGRFDEFSDAVAARKSAEVKYDFHANHGK